MRDCRGRIGGQIEHCHRFEQSEDAFVDAAERIANAAMIEVIAVLSVFGKAGRKEDGAVDGAHDLQRGNSIGILCQTVAAVSSMYGSQKSVFGQPLQHFRKYRNRDMESVRNLLGARASRAHHRQVLECDESVIGFFRELKHVARICD